MRTPVLLMCTSLAPVLLAGCASPTGPELEEVRFTLNGAVHSTTFASGGVGAYGLYLSTENWSAFGRLQFAVSPFTGRQTFPISPFDAAASASLRSLQGVEFDTRLFGGRGQIVVTDNKCRTSTGTDPVTGNHGTRTFCTVSGTFEFSAKSEAGDSVVVTKGRFHSTVQGS